ncbi:MAG TPA: porin, partial [Xanthobacteraceae bacterium]|nr:porin [Xanthobacteraceae bacterium]
MKNFKSLILGSAAAVLAVAGAQAADLPVKAKPVQYVKICSAYGAGFYYIPGTDICLRVGGYVWSDFSVNNRGINGELGTGDDRDRRDDWTAFRVRQALILDARTNTEYGTLRSYFAGGFQWDTSNNGQVFSQSTVGNWTWYYSAAFIQFAGFTFGLAGSFFNFDPGMTMFTFANKSVGIAPMIAYTAQLGSGISATISMEDGTARRNQIADLSFDNGANVADDHYAAQFMPDFIANLRVSQAWGDAQISGAIHQVKAEAAGSVFTTEAKNVEYGYAVLGGLNFKLPQIGAKDNFMIEGVWSKGAVAFTGINSSSYSKVTNLAYVTDGTGPLLDTFDALFV